MTKQKRIEELETELKEAHEIINTLRKEADEGFKASPECTRMQQDLKMYELSKWTDEQHIESGIRSDMRFLEQIRKIREDNVALCAEHGVEYWEGLTETDKWKFKDVQNLEKEITDLKAKLAAKDVIIEHYKDILAGRDPKEPKETVMGRKPIPEEQKNRVRSYRRNGFTLKEISEMEGLSIGAVSGICKGIKTTKSRTKKAEGRK